VDPILQLICGQQGVFLRSEAEALGYSDHSMAKAVATGEWVRVRRGAYVLGEIYADLDISARYDLLCRAAVRQTWTPVVLSHTSSLAQWGCPLWDARLTEVHLTRPDGNTQRREAQIRTHRGTLAEGDVARRNGLTVTSAVRAALEYTTVTDVEHSLVEIDDLLHRKLVNLFDLRARYAEMAQWPGTLITDLVLRLADSRSESVGETRARYLVWSQGLPPPEVNFPIYDESGREVARVDLAWPAYGLFLEFDGKVKYERLLKHGEHASDVVVREKKREDMICRLTGWRCIRLVWADLYQPAVTAAKIRAMFRPAAA
jgi:Transcriptional regulator, AbiEi antitoxin